VIIATLPVIDDIQTGSYLNTLRRRLQLAV